MPSSEAYAVFGHADFELSDAWELGAGLRYYDADLRNQNFTLRAFQGSNPFTLPPAFGDWCGRAERILDSWAYGDSSTTPHGQRGFAERETSRPAVSPEQGMKKKRPGAGFAPGRV